MIAAARGGSTGVVGGQADGLGEGLLDAPQQRRVADAVGDDELAAAAVAGDQALGLGRAGTAI